MHDALLQAIEAARPVELDALSRAVWADYATGQIDDEIAQALAERIQARRVKGGHNTFTGSLRTGAVALGHLRSIYPPKQRLQRAPDRSVAIERRRRLACSGPMPPSMAARFTTGQLAVLRIVADEVAEHGSCTLCLDAIAARAGVSRRLAQTTVRLAEGDGLLIVVERPRRGDRNDTNIVKVISREWVSWIVRGGRQGGCRKFPTTDKGDQKQDREAPVRNGKRTRRGAESGITVPRRGNYPPL